MFTRWTFKMESSTVSATHLVSSSNVFLIAVDVHPLGNVGRLLLQGHQDVARLVVKTCRVRHTNKLMLLSISSLPSGRQQQQQTEMEQQSCKSAKMKSTFGGVVVSNLADGVADDPLVVHNGTGGYLAG